MDERAAVQKIIEHQRQGKIFQGWVYAGVVRHLLSRNPFDVFDALHHINRLLGYDLSAEHNVTRFFLFRDQISLEAYAPIASDKDKLEVKVDDGFTLHINANFFNGFRESLYGDDDPDLFLGPLRHLPLTTIHCMYVSQPLLGTLRSYNWSRHQDEVDQMMARRFSVLDGCPEYRRVPRI